MSEGEAIVNERFRYVSSAALPLLVAATVRWVIAPLAFALDPMFGEMYAMVWYPVVVGFLAGLFGNARTAAVVGVATAASVMAFGWTVSGIVPVALLAGLLSGAWTWMVSALVRAIGVFLRRARG